MAIITIASVGPESERLKRKVRRREIPVIIRYKGQVYEIRWSELRNIGLDHREGVESLCAKLGMDDTGFFTKTCHYCGYNSTNIFNIMMGQAQENPEEDSVTIVRDASKLPKRCNYESQLGVEVASSFTDRRTGQRIRATEDPCAFNEGLVSYLADNGHLEPYRVEREFSFRPIAAFEYGLVDKKEAKDFALPTPVLSRVGYALKNLGMKVFRRK